MMRALFIILSIGIATILMAATCTQTGVKPATVIKNNDKGFVLMELFTSQGCSSCPRADDLLGTYADKNDEHIIPIAFHVDYWNQLGWNDSFSNAQYSQRQEKYDADFLHATVYTPQLIINGETEMVGSDAAKVKSAVDNALSNPATTIVTINNQTIINGRLQIQYNIDGNISNVMLNTAVVQNKTITKINAGENDGATLTNYNVVRSFILTAAKKTGNVVIDMPAGVNIQALSVVLFIQDNNTGKITGAVKKDL